MDVGIYIGGLATPATLDETIAAAQKARVTGLAGVWTAQALGWDSLTLLALVGAAVPHIGLGSAVVPTPQRHPFVLAGQALTVQAATDGRLTLGIGAGIGAMVQGMFGLPRDRPALRMREYLTVLQSLLHGEPVDFHGATLTAVGQLQVPDAQTPQVLVAALGAVMLQVAGELADGTVTWMSGPRTIAEHISPLLTQAARTAGRGTPRIVAGTLVCVTDEVDRARRAIASDYGLAATVPEYRAVLDREGASGVEDVAAIGDETAVARHLERLANAGATELVAAPFGTTAERVRTLTLLAEFNPGRNSVPARPLSDHDRAEIHELIALHGHLADDRRAADLGLLLTPDAVYDLREFGLGQVSGLPAIQALHEQRPGDQPLGHHVTNVQIEQPTDMIAVRSKGLSVMTDGTTGTCIYHDTVVKTPTGWRIAHRKVLPPRTD